MRSKMPRGGEHVVLPRLFGHHTMIKDTRKIMLIGYRASGKTTVGRALAARLGWRFLDMDAVLTERFGPIRDQVATDRTEEVSWAPGKAQERSIGCWERFRQREKALLAELISEENIVIATGGGAVLHQDLWPKVMAAGLVVWLTAKAAVIAARIAGDAATVSQRPSLTGKNAVAEIEEVLAERLPLYEQGCHLAFDSTAPVATIVDAIVAAQRKAGLEK